METKAQLIEVRLISSTRCPVPGVVIFPPHLMLFVWAPRSCRTLSLERSKRNYAENCELLRSSSALNRTVGTGKVGAEQAQREADILTYYQVWTVSSTVSYAAMMDAG